jgi:hypothetical protein
MTIVPATNAANVIADNPTEMYYGRCGPAVRDVGIYDYLMPITDLYFIDQT